MRKTKIIFWGFLVLLACAVMAAFAWFPSAQFVDAQTTRSDEEIRKRNRDKSVTDEKLVRVRDEASAVQASVFTLMKAEFPKFSHFTGQVHDPKAQAVGRRGQTGFSLGWNKGDTRFFLNV